MRNRFLDTETVGFHGIAVLIQHAVDDGPINLHNIFLEPIIDTLKLIEEMSQDCIVGFNLTFDWFHICKTYTTLVLLGEKVGYDALPIDHIDLYGTLEADARDGHCVKPASALDLLLHAKKGPYQSTMDRKDIRIKRVPKILAPLLVKELEARVVLKDIYFARRKDKKRWHITEVADDLVDVTLKFAAAARLKDLAIDALGVDTSDVLLFGDAGVDPKFRPLEYGWAPFSTAFTDASKGWQITLKNKTGKRRGYAAPYYVRHHVNHWAYLPRAQRYAKDDVEYVRKLYEHFGRPVVGDDDSIAACMVASVRWRGFAVDLDYVAGLKREQEILSKLAPKAPSHVYKYVSEVMTEAEKASLVDSKTNKPSTKKVILERIAKLPARECDCEDSCPKCKGKHPAAERAKASLDARQADTKIALYNKLIIAGRLHVSIKVIGALSGRVAGDGGLNSTGIQHEKIIRRAFTLAPHGFQLDGGDFSSYEVSIADARYNDPELRKQLLTCFSCQSTRRVEDFEQTYCPACGGGATKCGKCKGTVVVDKTGGVLRDCGCGQCSPTGDVEDTLRKIHGLFGQELAEGDLTYEQVLATKGKVPDYYDMGKRGIFAKFYGGNYFTLMTRLGIDEERAIKADEGFDKKYEGVGRARAEIARKFCSMVQEVQFGPVEWHEPHEYAESLTGFRRYFTLENSICKALFDLANSPPEDWTRLKIKVVRRDREQKVGGAVRSAVFAAAFNVQSQNMRAAANHEIQSTGATGTKKLQCRIWKLQPIGVNPWVVLPFQCHDEIMAPIKAEKSEEMKQIVRDYVLEHRALIPLLKIDWQQGMKDWSQK